MSIIYIFQYNSHVEFNRKEHIFNPDASSLKTYQANEQLSSSA